MFSNDNFSQLLTNGLNELRYADGVMDHKFQDPIFSSCIDNLFCLAQVCTILQTTIWWTQVLGSDIFFIPNLPQATLLFGINI